MTTFPTVSVLLPVYNASPFVEEAVLSILGQTYGDFELIVIDDGSTDGSGDLLQLLADLDPRIRFISRENRGLVATLNEMLAIARGRFIARMDADDVSRSDRFDLQVASLSADPSLVAVGSDFVSIDAKGRPLYAAELPRTHEDIDDHTMAGDRGSGMSHPALMIRSDALLRVGGYRPDYWPAEDADLVLRLAEVGKLRNLRAPLLSYRVHPASIGHTNASRQRDAHWRAIKDAAARRGIEPPESRPMGLVPGEGWSVGELHVKWAWWALGSGYIGSARSLAFRAVLSAPLSPGAWRVLACAIRGH